MSKTILITESGNRMLIKHMILEKFVPDVDKILLVKKYLDKNFVKYESNDIGKDGFPKKSIMIGISDGNGSIINTIDYSNAFYMLQEKFKYIYENEEKRDSFLKQILNDWINNNIDDYGTLSVNSI